MAHVGPFLALLTPQRESVLQHESMLYYHNMQCVCGYVSSTSHLRRHQRVCKLLNNPAFISAQEEIKTLQQDNLRLITENQLLVAKLDEARNVKHQTIQNAKH